MTYYAIKFNGQYVETGLPWTLHSELNSDVVYRSLESLVVDVEILSYEAGEQGYWDRCWVGLHDARDLEIVEVEKEWEEV